MKTGKPLLLLASAALIAMAAPASAETQVIDFSSGAPAVAAPVAKPGASGMDLSKQRAARMLAGLLNDRHFAGVLSRHMAKHDDRVSINQLMQEYAVTGAQARVASDALRDLDLALRQLKGIDAHTSHLLQLRLYVPQGYAGRIDWSDITIAYTPGGNDRERQPVQAFGRQGRVLTLDSHTPPSVPVLIAGLDEKADLKAGIASANAMLQAAGLQSPVAASKSGDIETSRLDHIRLSDDQEPWISGAAEVYAVVSGIQPDQDKAVLSLVDMPYLDHDGSSYYPGQLLVFWSEYRYVAANVQLFEHDDNTNYRDLVLALSQGVNALLVAFAPGYAVVGQIATTILQAMPDRWYSNDDDYLDSFYTLEKGQVYANRYGAAGNASVTLTPYLLRAQQVQH